MQIKSRCIQKQAHSYTQKRAGHENWAEPREKDNGGTFPNILSQYQTSSLQITLCSIIKAQAQ